MQDRLVLRRPEFPCTDLEGTDMVSIKVMLGWHRVWMVAELAGGTDGNMPHLDQHLSLKKNKKIKNHERCA